MTDPAEHPTFDDSELIKAPTGIRGFDEVVGGGLPQGRPTLVCGGPGCGKTLFGMEFLVRGAGEFGEPGVFVSFEESKEDLVKNVQSLGLDLKGFIDKGKIFVEYIYVERSEIEETGDFTLDGLFVRLADSTQRIGAKRIVLDTVETLFSSGANELVLRAELRRLFRWLKDRGLTAVVTGEKGVETFTRHGLEEYLSDCVVFLDHRVTEQLSTRRLRIVKYRGSGHVADECPFLIDQHGFSVLPITSVGLTYQAPKERIPTGIARLDTMLGGSGYYRGSSVLFSGTAGTGKTSFAAFFADAVCRRNERCLYLAYEESSDQILRNTASIGLDLQQWVDKGLLKIHAYRPTAYGLERHLVMFHTAASAFQPAGVVMDPISNLMAMGAAKEVKMLLMRVVDYLKREGITSVFTDLTEGDKSGTPFTEVGISSLIDTWIQLKDIESSGEFNHGLRIVKSRGMDHSNQLREYRLTDHGVDVLNVYSGPGGVLTGTARAAQEARDRAEVEKRQLQIEAAKRKTERNIRVREAQIAALQAQNDAEAEEMRRSVETKTERLQAVKAIGDKIAKMRSAD